MARQRKNREEKKRWKSDLDFAYNKMQAMLAGYKRAREDESRREEDIRENERRLLECAAALETPAPPGYGYGTWDEAEEEEEEDD